jgi:predicted  nucleic acid-binding Zn-ribbon protein
LQEVGHKKEGEIAQLSRKLLSSQNDASGLRYEVKKITEEKELLQKNHNEVTRKNNELIALMVEKERVFQEELVRLSSKIHPLSDQKIIEFKNRLKESLKPDYGMLEEIKHIEMTINVGNNLRALMFKIFNKLTDEGVSF